MSNESNVKRISDVPPDFQVLIDESVAEGFRMLQRLKDEWESGRNRFSLRDEAIWEARLDGQLIGVCGLNRDPYIDDSSIGRIRHLYVTKYKRRAGIGRTLVEHALRHAEGRFQIVRLRAGQPPADLFYDVLGFARTPSEPESTHAMRL